MARDKAPPSAESIKKAHQKAARAILPLLQRSHAIATAVDDSNSFFSYKTLCMHAEHMTQAPSLDYLTGYVTALLANIDMHRAGDTNITIGYKHTSQEDTWIDLIHAYMQEFCKSLRVENPLAQPAQARG